jgi:hypothetical protein
MNPKLLDTDNISLDAIKRRKLELSNSSTQSSITTGTSKSSSVQLSVSGSSMKHSHQASETVADKDDTSHRNAGQPKDPEATEDKDDEIMTPVTPPKSSKTGTQTNSDEENCEKEGSDNDEEELGKSISLIHDKLI